MIGFFKKLFKKPEKWIAVDVELDGGHPNHIIQLSYLIIEGRRVRGKNFYFATNYVNHYARKVHGLGVYELRKLSGGQSFADRAEEIYRDFADCKLIIGHDVGGDLRYIRSELAHSGKKLPELPIFCTLKHYTEEAHIPLKDNPNKLKPPKLTELCEHFGLGREYISRQCSKWFGGGERAHDARYDAAAAYLVMLIGENMA